jgi:hypothetical protein
MKKMVLVVALSVLPVSSVMAAEVSIISPKDGDKVPSTFTVKFGAQDVAIVPAGTDQENSGHHHLVIDSELPDLSKPMGAEVKHFGKAQTETELTLKPGKHTLQLVLGDKAHKPHSPAIISKKITVEVID